VNATLRPAGVAAGQGQSEVGEVVCVFVRNSTDHEAKRQDGEEREPPVPACPGSARIAHRGFSEFLKAQNVGRI
jgi:hypothetical protein